MEEIVSDNINNKDTEVVATVIKDSEEMQVEEIFNSDGNNKDTEVTVTVMKYY